MKRWLVILSLFGIASYANARPDFLEVFVKTYQPKSLLTELGCKICHTDPPRRNAYGKAIKDAGTGGDLTLATLQAVEGLDSDGDGVSNKDEIAADTAPGEANAPVKVATPPPPPAAEAGLIPKHGFHPVIIHFPIALFIFGALLELIGWRKKDGVMRQSGWYCLLAGSVTSLGAVATGLYAFFQNGYGWEGQVLIHFILAVSSTVLMLGTTAWRRKGAHESMAYIILLLLTAILVGVTGHFGGNLVYG